MSSGKLVTIAGATGAQGGAVLRSLAETGKYKIRALTRDSKSGKAQALKKLSKDIELVDCDTTKSDDVQKAFKDSWAVFALTDYWAQPEKPEAEVQQGAIMADAAASLNVTYYISSTLEDVHKLSNGKYDVPHFSGKAKIRAYIQEKHPTLKTIYVEPGMYMQNWQSQGKLPKTPDGTALFLAPLEVKTKLHLADIEDMGPVVREILENPDKFVGSDVCICGEVVTFEDVAKGFTKVTGIPAVAQTVTEAQFRESVKFMPQIAQDDLFYMYKWFEEFGYYGKVKDYTTGQKLTKLSTWEEWLKKSGWKGE